MTSAAPSLSNYFFFFPWKATSAQHWAYSSIFHGKAHEPPPNSVTSVSLLRLVQHLHCNSNENVLWFHEWHCQFNGIFIALTSNVSAQDQPEKKKKKTVLKILIVQKIWFPFPGVTAVVGYCSVRAGDDFLERLSPPALGGHCTDLIQVVIIPKTASSVDADNCARL